MNLSKIMGSMTLRERRMLNEAVKQRIVEAAAPALTMAELADAATTAYDAYKSSLTPSGLDLAKRAYKAWKIADCQMNFERVLDLAPDGATSNTYPALDRAIADFNTAMALPGDLDAETLTAAKNAGHAAAKKSLQDAQPQAATVGAATPETAASSAAEANQSAATPAASTAPSDASLIGSTLSTGGKVVFELTEEGWKTTLRISEEQILALVIPAVKEEVKKQMRTARGQGAELHIIKSSLTDPGAANKSNELFLKRDGEEFADPVVIPVAKMAEIMKKQSLAYTSGTDPNRQDTLEDTQSAFARGEMIPIGAALIGFKKAEAGLFVPSDKLSGFDDLFGTANNGKIRLAIQKAAGTKSLVSFKIPLSWAMDGSIMKYMSDSILRGVGIGKIEFKLQKIENIAGDSSPDCYVASVKLNPKEIAALKAKLGARADANASEP
jgi:hypothetical protein